ncbi:MAG: ATP synthase F1 subunit delta [Bacteroidales bacterium]|nr:ATP synthase F1 subunit delta [Bacteroidales bacterium]
MNSGLLAKRYAAALEQYCSECSQGEECLGNARRMLAVLPALGDYLGKPLPAASKMEVFRKAVPDMCTAFERFLYLVVAHRRESGLRRILIAFIAEYKRVRGIVDAQLTVAGEPSQQLLERLRSMTMAAGGATSVDIEVEIDPGIIGGFIYKVADKRMDASVRRQLHDLKKAFETNNNKRII